MSISQFIEGWKNNLGSDNVSIEAVAEKRLEKCRQCPFNSKNTVDNRFRPDEHCTKCGCTLSAKVRSMSSSCPIGRWGAE